MSKSHATLTVALGIAFVIIVAFALFSRQVGRRIDNAGGSAWLGRVDNGQYLVRADGDLLREVSEETWRELLRLETISFWFGVIATLSLIFFVGTIGLISARRFRRRNR